MSEDLIGEHESPTYCCSTGMAATSLSRHSSTLTKSPLKDKSISVSSSVNTETATLLQSNTVVSPKYTPSDNTSTRSVSSSIRSEATTLPTHTVSSSKYSPSDTAATTSVSSSVNSKSTQTQTELVNNDTNTAINYPDIAISDKEQAPTLKIENPIDTNSPKDET